MENIYNNALDELIDKNYDDASKEFDEVERQHPYSIWSRKSILLSAYARYKRSEYELAISSLDRFIRLYPASDDIDYAYYLKSICYYEQIIDAKRDQSQARQAFDALNEVANRFPDSDYASDAKYKINVVEDHLASKEMEVGRTYLKLKRYLGAARRFKKVITDYETTNSTAEALARLVEVYLILGVEKEALINASVLGHNYPNSDWYRYAYNLLKKNRINTKIYKIKNKDVN